MTQPLKRMDAQGKSRLHRWLLLLVPVAVSLLVGNLAAFLQADALKNWYPYLNKAPLTPPNAVFPIAWTILYIAMGISVGLILQTGSSRKKRLTQWFALQLFLNFSWCILFFTLKNPLAGLICIVLLDAVVTIYLINAWPVRKASALLFLPYLLWILFATYLNAYIFLNN